MFHSKIHRAVITHADLEYEGSVTIDEGLMRAAQILPNEAVHLWNVTQGTRLMTYALPGPENSGVICVNGAAAHGNHPGDTLIIATFVEVEDVEARVLKPTVVRVNSKNQIIGISQEIPGPTMPSLRSGHNSSMETLPD